MNQFQYKTIDTSSIQGIKDAEQLKATGWTIYRTGLFLVYFQRKVSK